MRRAATRQPTTSTAAGSDVSQTTPIYSGFPSASHGGGVVLAGDLQLLIDDLQRSLHGHGSKPADPIVERVVEEVEQQQHRRDHGDHGADEQSLDDRPLAAVGEEQHEHEDQAGAEEQHDPERRRNHADGAVNPIASSLLSRRCLLQPVVVGRLLGRCLRFDCPQGPEQLHPPGVDLFSQRPGLHALPLHPRHRAGVADQLAGQLTRHRRREELRRLDLLGHGERLRLGAGVCRVVAGEGQEDHEAEQHGETGRQHAEHAGGTVAVVEIAAIGRAAAHQQDRRDRTAVAATTMTMEIRRLVSRRPLQGAGSFGRGRRAGRIPAAR